RPPLALLFSPIDATLECVDVRLDLGPGDALPRRNLRYPGGRHRFLPRCVRNTLTGHLYPTANRAHVSGILYPPAFPRAFASWAILPPPAVRRTGCSREGETDGGYFVPTDRLAVAGGVSALRRDLIGEQWGLLVVAPRRSVDVLSPARRPALAGSWLRRLRRRVRAPAPLFLS